MKLKSIFSKYQNYLLVIALVLSSLAISIRSKNGNISLVLNKYPGIIFFLIVLSTILVAIYYSLNSRKISDLSNQIVEQSKTKGEAIRERLNDLTERQREVYELIIEGKSNKEIMAILYIEKSTLKSHINQIYKKLNIKNRMELKSSSKAHN